jgi:hypothetical protein
MKDTKAMKPVPLIGDHWRSTYGLLFESIFAGDPDAEFENSREDLKKGKLRFDLVLTTGILRELKSAIKKVDSDFKCINKTGEIAYTTIDLKKNLLYTQLFTDKTAYADPDDYNYGNQDWYAEIGINLSSGSIVDFNVSYDT